MMSASSNVLLITGIPGIGKTTVAKKVVTSLADHNIGGFYTEEIRVNNVRQGFELITIQGERFVMAHVDSDSAYRVGKYGVDVEIIDTAIAMTLSEDPDTEVFIIDEIGKMECFSKKFRAAMRGLLDSGRPLVATVALRGGGFIAEVKGRPDVEIWEVTKANRNEMPAQILRWLERRYNEP